jgi:hypothetical protein
MSLGRGRRVSTVALSHPLVTSDLAGGVLVVRAARVFFLRATTVMKSEALHDTSLAVCS